MYITTYMLNRIRNKEQMLCGCHVFGNSTKMASIANDQYVLDLEANTLFPSIFLTAQNYENS